MVVVGFKFQQNPEFLDSHIKQVEKHSGDWKNFIGKFQKSIGNIALPLNPIARPLAECEYGYLGKILQKKVVNGNDGWLFYAYETNNRQQLDYAIGNKQIRTEQVKQWRLAFLQRQAFCKSLDIPYKLVLTPDKSTIYPEYLGFERNDSFKTVLDFVVEDLKANTNIDFIDLTNDINSAKQKQQVYYKTDSHWNNLGANIGADAIIKWISDTLPLVEPEHYELIEKLWKGGDLTRMASIDSLQNEDIVIWWPYENAPFSKIKPPALEARHLLSIEAYQNENNKLPKAVMIHDSFGIQLRRFLANSFSYSVYPRTWQCFYPNFIEKQQPDVVINQVVERSFIGFNEGNDPELINDYWDENFKKEKSLQKDFETAYEMLEHFKTINKQGELIVAKVELDLTDDTRFFNNGTFYWLKKGTNTFYLELDIYDYLVMQVVGVENPDFIKEISAEYFYY